MQSYNTNILKSPEPERNEDFNIVCESILYETSYFILSVEDEDQEEETEELETHKTKKPPPPTGGA